MQLKGQIIRTRSEVLPDWQHAETQEEVGMAIVRQIQCNMKNAKAQLLGFKFEVNYDSDLRITHSAPVGEKTRWGPHHREERDRQQHVGFRGRVWFLYSVAPHGFADGSPLANVRFHTGTGGYGGYGGPWTPADGYPLGYDCQFFLQDWPEFASTIRTELAMRRIETPNSKQPIQLNFEWRKEHDERS